MSIELPAPNVDDVDRWLGGMDALGALLVPQPWQRRPTGWLDALRERAREVCDELDIAGPKAPR